MSSLASVLRAGGILCAFSLLGCESDTIIPSRECISPEQLDFGPRAIGQRHTKMATLTNCTGEVAVVGGLRFDPDVAAYIARLPGNNETLTGQALGANRSLEFIVSFDPTEVRSYDTTMLMPLGETLVPLPILGAGEQQPISIAVMPTAVELGPVPLGTTRTQSLIVQNQGEGPVRLREVLLGGDPQPPQLAGSTFYVTRGSSQNAVRDLDFAPGEQHILTVHYQPTLETEHHVDLELQIEDAEPIVVPAFGIGFRPGTLSCAPEALDFGAVGRGRTERQRVTCTAMGGGVGIANASFVETAAPPFIEEGAPRPGQLIRSGESVGFDIGFRSLGLPSFHPGRFVIEPVGGALPTTLLLSGEVVPPTREDTGISVELTWDTVRTDLDLHFVRGNRPVFDQQDDCYFRQRNPNWGVVGESIDDPFLDRDDTNGEGPETMNLLVAAEPEYNVYVHFYKKPADAPVTVARVQVYSAGQLVAQPTHQLTVCGELWHVGRITANAGTFSPTNTITSLPEPAACQ